MRALAIFASAASLVLAVGGCEIRPYTLQFGDGGAGQLDGSVDATLAQDAGRDAQRDAGPDGPLCVPLEEVCNGQDDDCDGLTDNVADSKLESDPNNCGACGLRCVLPHAIGVCTARACVFTQCEGAWGDANGDLDQGLAGSDGCECLKSNGGKEICDGKDNDCDGLTDLDDPDLPTHESELGTNCTPPGGCPGNPPVCKGICSFGTFTCHPDGYLYCAGAQGPQPEVCDGLDNNCDGKTDEGVDVQLCYPHATGCTLSSGECQGVCKIGVRLCLGSGGGADHYGDCNGDVGPGTEICDGLDNDCNGQTDEGTLPGVGASCYPTHGCPGGVCRGICQPGTRICNAGRLECQNPVGPQAEVCDGLDNDCNGVTDDGLPPKPCYTKGSGCVEGAGGNWTCNGICRLGWIVCRGDQGWSGCEGDVGPATEVCNGVDDNCDGQIDVGTMAGVGVACYPGQGCPSGQCQGACAAGTTVCQSGDILCPDAKGPSVEMCNGVDDDCDGDTDEELPDRSCYTLGDHCDPETGVCRGSCKLGRTTCQNGGWSGCLEQVGPALETCNGIDEDCDGVTDNPPAGEQLPGVGVNCYPPQGCPSGNCLGTCGPGTTVCQAGQVTCPDAHGPVAETCNGLDDDCDGATDNGMTPKLCYPDNTDGCDPANGTCKGLCRFGRSVCNGTNGWSGCDSPAPVTPTPEECNGVDDDCDGFTDTGTMPGVAVACYPAQGCPSGNCLGECAAGSTICQTGQVVCPDAKGPSAEICDNKDNDCDGTTDQNEQVCYTGGDECSTQTGQCKGVCRVGLRTCTAGTFGNCTGEVLPQPETCNGRDDDCDDTIDGTDTILLTQGCYTGPGGTQDVGQCHGGNQTCQPASGTWGICTGQVVPGVESCNNIDDDCDGVTDQLEQVCYSGGDECDTQTGQCKGICRVGLTTCVGGNWNTTCSGEVKPGIEVCNGKDDDCDDTVDGTNAVLLTQACYTGPSGTENVGVCHGGTQTCQPVSGTWGSCANQVVPSVESCNAADDDCDATTDNVAPSACYPAATIGCSVVAGTCVGECRLGQASCSSGLPTCGGPLKTPLPEVCDGKDNNCDGDTDNGSMVGIGVTCYPSAGCPGNVCQGACHPGTTACQSGSVVCQNAQEPVAETCNDIDDDCDGDTDNGFVFESDVHHCGDCYTDCTTRPAAQNAVARCENRGCLFTCYAGFYDLDGDPANGCEYSCTPTGVEVCDGLDNDCDGKIDLLDTDAAPNGLIVPNNFCAQDGSCGGAVPVCRAFAPVQVGDQGQQLSSWQLSGANLLNTAAGVLHVRITDVAGTRTVSLYTDAGLTNLVAQGSRSGDGLVVLAPMSGSGLSGSVHVAYVADDSTVSIIVPLPADFDDQDNQLTAWAIYGASVTNTNAGVLYATVTNSGITRTVSLYQDAGRTLLVAQGSRDNNGSVVLAAAGGSGLTGTVAVTFVGDDLDIKVPVLLPRENGDAAGQLTDWNLRGASEFNTDSGFLYATLQDSAGTRTVSLYSDSARAPADLVAEGSLSGNGLVTLTAALGSGLSGSVQVSYTADDSNLVLAVAIYTWVCNYDPQLVNVVGLNQVAFTEFRCDNADNNCDGVPDEAFVLKGQACDNGMLGVCKIAGQYVCTADQSSVECNALPGTPQTETCDGTDQNCNGVLDDGAQDDMITVGTPFPGAGYRVDTYEASRPDARHATAGALEHRSCSMPDAIPWASVTHGDAAAACFAAGKRLCTEAEWQLACGGPGNWLYPYAELASGYLPNTCNGYDYDPDCTGANDDVVLPTGTPIGCNPKPATTQCTNPTYATVDMSGNLREWTSSVAGTSGAYRIRGGSYDDIGAALSCRFNFWALPPTISLPNIGFRCCTRCAGTDLHCPSTTACTSDAECAGGFCDTALDALGVRHCAFCQPYLANFDDNSCGGCGVVCGAGTTCQYGVCK